jgi:hypothetical protein
VEGDVRGRGSGWSVTYGGGEWSVRWGRWE